MSIEPKGESEIGHLHPHAKPGDLLEPSTNKEKASVDDHADLKQSAFLGLSYKSALPDGTADSIYEAKARILNAAIQEIGMGAYQWKLFIVIGFGWASDNLWPIVTSLILTPVAQEFKVTRPPLLALAQNLGLLAGALFWGFGCDLFGRKVGFNLTIGITSLFALVSAASPNFTAIAVFTALWSSGVGGNLPVDSAIFLEFLPGSHQYLLTVLSVFWSLAQLLVTLVAWPLLANLTCQPTDTDCTRVKNFGWRWFMIAIGGFALIMFMFRIFAFTLFESPKYLMGKGRDADAVAVIHQVASRNGRTSTIKLAHLEAVELGAKQAIDARAVLTRQLVKFDAAHLRALFATPVLVRSTLLIVTIWALIGLGFPLYNEFIPFIQAQRGIDFKDGSRALTYRNSLIIAAVGLPGALIGGLAVQSAHLRRRGALGIATALTGVCLFASTTATNSDALLGWNCAFNLLSTVMYSVLYSYTPETFLTKDRGTGNALAASANRIFGIMAPVVAMYGDLHTAVPVYVSGALLIGAGLLTVGLPLESHGRASL